MPPKSGIVRVRRSLTAIVSALALSALALLSAIPAATRSAADDGAATARTRTVVLTATASGFTDRQRKNSSYTGAVTAKVNKSRYATYVAFPAVTLSDGESILSATLTVKTKQAEKAAHGYLAVRPVLTSWAGQSLTYKSRPKVGPVIGTVKIRSNKKITASLNTRKAAAYLVTGASVRLTRHGSNAVVKVAPGSSKLVVVIKSGAGTTAGASAGTTAPSAGTSTSTASASPSATVSASSPATQSTAAISSVMPGNPVFGMYFPPYPLSLDNRTPSQDYYSVNYLKASGENGKWAAVGGLLRDRPIGREPLSGDYQLTDMKTEVNEAISAGLNGFTACVLTTDPTDRNEYLVEKLMKAASSISSSFKVMLMPDMTAMPDISAEDFAAGMARLGKYDSVYKTAAGQVLIAPFYAEGYDPSFYATALSLMKSEYGVDAALMPIFLDANNMAKFNSVSVAFANWGIRDAYIASHDAYWPNWVAKAHALGKPWMEPIAVQDERPNQQIYDESSNTETLRATWNRAITQGADLTMLVTWNDYSECTSFAPSVDHGWAFLDINKYFMTKYQTGSYPAITTDEVIIDHRIQKASTLPTSYTAVMKLRSSAAQTQPRDKIEVVTMLTKSATMTVTIAGQNYTYTAPAGFNAQLFDLAEGYFTATASRDGQTVATVTTKDAVKFTTEQQDLSYHAVTSLNR